MFKERQAAALKINWRDVVPVDQIRDFLLAERVYCREEESSFYDCTGEDVYKKEKLRTAVLEKRKDFLDLWTKVFNNKNNK